MKDRILAFTRAVLRSAGTRQGLVMVVALLVAGVFDYLVNVVVARNLTPAEFSVFVAVTALLQVLVYLTNVIRNVVAFYTAELTVKPQALANVAGFLRWRWRWSMQWGILATVGMIVLSPWIANLLHLSTPWPLWASSPLVLLLFLRPVTDGALQGLQKFADLGSVQVLQAGLRLFLAPALIWLGWQAAGALFSLPLASLGALCLALWLLRPYFQTVREKATVPKVSWHYSLHTLMGLLAFALMINVDAIAVKRFFSPELAGQYGPVVVLGKINLFIPIGIGLVLFPKVTQRRASGQDTWPILLLALSITMLPGLLLTLVYSLIPAELVQTIFSGAYADPGPVLWCVGLATTLYAGVNIWLNYALSMQRPIYVYALVAVVIGQIMAMAFFNSSLLMIAVVMIIAGLAGNLAGLLTMVRVGEADEPKPS